MFKRVNEGVHVGEEGIAFDPAVAISFGDRLVQRGAELFDLDAMGVERLLGELFNTFRAPGGHLGFGPSLKLGDSGMVMDHLREL